MSCPMAFDNQGATWLQNTNLLANPYFGEMMLRCGSVDAVISNPVAENTRKVNTHE